MASADPITEFLNAVERAQAHQVDTAPMSLATVDARGRPSVRMVLLRGVDQRGFVFHTNYDSRKGRDLAANPHAALCFHWVTLDEQIRVEGTVARLPSDESDAYFAGRPRGSQLGAWASDQSAVLPSRETLEEQYREVERRFEGADEIGWLALADCRKPAGPFLTDRDVGLFDDRPRAWFPLPMGHFALFFPDDAHAPLAGLGPVTKAVVKVLL